MMKYKLLIYVSLLLAVIAPISSSVAAADITNKNLNKNFKKDDDEITNVITMSNVYAAPESSQVVYGSKSALKLRIFDIVKSSMRLPRVYLVLPKGLQAINGVSGVQKAIDEYSQDRNIQGKITVKQLAKTENGREVYELIPLNGAYVLKGTAAPTAILPVIVNKEILPNNQISMNANTIEEFNNNVIYYGAGDGTDVEFDSSVGHYPAELTKDVGIKSTDDSLVRGIVYNNIKVVIDATSPQVEDTYNIVDLSDNNKLLKTVKKQGQLSTKYSRVGLINSLKVLELDPEIYDKKLLQVDIGELTGEVTLDTQAEISNDPNQVYFGTTYKVFVKEKAARIVIRYQDKNGREIHSDKIINGDLGDTYDASTSDYQLAIRKYQLDKEQLPDNIKGEFGKTEIVVTYIYEEDSPNMTTMDPPKLSQSEKTVKKKTDSKKNKPDAVKNRQTREKQVSTSTKKAASKKDNYRVIIRYVDQDGKLIAKDDVLQGEKGVKYFQKAKQIKGYSLVSGPKVVKGSFGEEN